jgi:hypothetical protein
LENLLTNKKGACRIQSNAGYLRPQIEGRTGNGSASSRFGPMEMSIEQLGALLGGFVVVVVSVVRALLPKANAAQAKRNAEAMVALLVGDDDATPKEQQVSTGVIKLAMRAELEPVTREQGRVRTLLTEHTALLKLLVDDTGRLHERHAEHSDRLAQAEIKAKVEALTSSRSRVAPVPDLDAAPDEAGEQPTPIEGIPRTAKGTR